MTLYETFIYCGTHSFVITWLNVVQCGHILWLNVANCGSVICTTIRHIEPHLAKKYVARSGTTWRQVAPEKGSRHQIKNDCD